jgi:hypothetical protein
MLIYFTLYHITANIDPILLFEYFIFSRAFFIGDLLETGVNAQ